MSLDLSDSALITLDDARRYLSLSDSDVDDDPDLAAMVEAASRQIMLFAGRQFAPAASAEERPFDYDGGSYLSLADNDLRAATLVTLTYAGGDPITLDTTRYSLHPRPPRDGVYTYLRLRRHHHRHARLFWPHTDDDVDAEISITGDWGFETVPTDVQLACKMQVAVWHRGDRTAFTRSYNADAGTVSGGDGLAGSVKALLYGGNYCKPVVG